MRSEVQIATTAAPHRTALGNVKMDHILFHSKEPCGIAAEIMSGPLVFFCLASFAPCFYDEINLVGGHILHTLHCAVHLV